MTTIFVTADMVRMGPRDHCETPEKAGMHLASLFNNGTLSFEDEISVRELPAGLLITAFYTGFFNTVSADLIGKAYNAKWVMRYPWQRDILYISKLQHIQRKYASSHALHTGTHS